MANVKYSGTDAENPLMEGSMFAYGNSDNAILSSNNLKDGYGFDISCLWKRFDVYDAQGSVRQKLLNDIGNLLDGFTDGGMTENGKCRVANAEDWADLTTDKYIRYYGILYGDECEETLSSNKVTNTYTEPGDVKGMRGCFVCDPLTGKHLFFPIGNTGYGRRKYIDNTNRDPATHPKQGEGVLKYASRTSEMEKGTAEKVPNYYSLWNGPGAVYLYGERKMVSNGSNPSDTLYHYGFDINYFSFGFEEFAVDMIKNHGRSDFCFIRRIDN